MSFSFLAPQTSNHVSNQTSDTILNKGLCQGNNRIAGRISGIFGEYQTWYHVLISIIVYQSPEKLLLEICDHPKNFYSANPAPEKSGNSKIFRPSTIDTINGTGRTVTYTRAIFLNNPHKPDTLGMEISPRVNTQYF